MNRKFFLKTAPVILTLFIFGCSNIPYKIDIEQGNIVTTQQIESLSLGMSQDDVKLVLGTPIIVDTFHENTWNYVTYYKNGIKQEVEQSRLVLYFKDGVLSKIDDSQFKEIDIAPINYDK